MVNFHTNCCRIIREVVELAAKGQVSIFRRGHSDSRYVNIELTEDHGELKPAVDMTVTVKVEQQNSPHWEVQEPELLRFSTVIIT